MIGPNASGKTNFDELFTLLRRIYEDREPFPFLDWWGYDNVVWDRKEELPITVKLFFESNGYNYSFETIFTGVGGRFQILKEAFEIEGILTLEREGGWRRVRHDEKFLEDAWEKIQRMDESDSAFHELLEKRKEDLLEQSVRIDKEITPYSYWMLEGLSSRSFSFYKNLALVEERYERQVQQLSSVNLRAFHRRGLRNGPAFVVCRMENPRFYKKHHNSKGIGHKKNERAVQAKKGSAYF
uniref:ATPase AAA-type core domain-containing protein n=1 Tax=Candidatus Methanophagaceae archaeon ANME-1 ERB6 TaxID=2759912 RepID=A0A7G9YV77_9EURY|nr:hypothetical protein OCNPINJI_00005 [Methanosarcinales archaeon ANME-1 ERB6]